MKIIAELCVIAEKFPALQSAVIQEIKNRLKIIEMGRADSKAAEIGVKEGKLKAVKFLKDETGLTLMECKRHIEKVFEDNGLKFYNYD